MAKKVKKEEKPKFEVCYRDSITISVDTLYRLMTDCAFAPQCINLYLYFLSRANANGDCEASYKEITNDVGITNAQLVMMAKHLEKNGYINVEQMWTSGDGIHYENRYKIIPQNGLVLGKIYDKESYGSIVNKTQRGLDSAVKYMVSILSKFNEATEAQRYSDELHNSAPVVVKRCVCETPPEEIYGGRGPYLP